MTETDRITIEQRIMEKGKPENLEQFRKVHSHDMGEPIADVDISAYFRALKASGLDGLTAAKSAIGAAEIIENDKLPIAERRRTAEAICAAVQVLPRRLIFSPVRQAVTVYKRR